MNTAKLHLEYTVAVAENSHFYLSYWQTSFGLRTC